MASELTDSLLSSFKSSPILATGIGVWGAAMLTFITKDIPKKLVELFKKEFTTSIGVALKEREFVALTSWIAKQKFSKTPRVYQIRDQIITAGPGLHFFIFKSHLCWFEKADSNKNKEFTVNMNEQKPLTEVRFGYFGRKKEFLIKALQESTAWNPSHREDIHIFTTRWRDWNHVASQPKSDLNQIIIPAASISELRQHLNWFFSSEEWFRKNGIPYRTGICLHGPPGTGKTSLVRAIASEWDLSVYSVDFSNLDDSELKDVIWKVGPRAIILMEDIDTIQSSQKRELAELREEISVRSKKMEVTLGGLLNAIDGVVDSDGRVFIVTTNHFEKLDPALLRPGRVNIKMNLNYMNDEMFHKAFKKYFPEFIVPSEVNWKNDISPAYFQSLVFNNLDNANFVLEGCREKTEGSSLYCISTSVNST